MDDMEKECEECLARYNLKYWEYCPECGYEDLVDMSPNPDYADIE